VNVVPVAPPSPEVSVPSISSRERVASFFLPSMTEKVVRSLSFVCVLICLSLCREKFSADLNYIFSVADCWPFCERLDFEDSPHPPRGEANFGSPCICTVHTV